MLEHDALALVEQLRGDPPRALAELRAVAVAVTGAPAAVLWRGAGEAARWAGTFTESVELLDRAIAAARAAGRDDLVRHAQLTLAGTLHLSGDTPGALAALAEAEAGATGALAAKAAFQRATIMAREGRVDEALRAYATGLAGFEAAGDRYLAAATLGNRALLRLEIGEAGGARDDLLRAQQLFSDLGVASSVAWMEHNLAKVASRQGDTAAALGHLRRAEEQLAALDIDPTEVQANRCEVLLQAGLYREAESAARLLAERAGRRGLALEHGEAALHLAQALLGQLRRGEAAAAAAVAAAAFEQQGRRGWAQRAAALALSGTPPAERADHGWDAVEELTAMGQTLAAVQTLATIADSDPGRAEALLDRLNLGRERPLEISLAALAVRVAAARQRGEVRRALRLTERALSIAEDQRATLGSADLRAGVSAQLDEIRTAGLQIRLVHSSRAGVLRWVERCRHAADIGTSVSPGDGAGEVLAELRGLQAEARAATAPTADLLRRQAATQQRLLQVLRQRRVSGHGSADQRLARLDAFGDVTVVQHHEHDGELGAIVVVNGRTRQVTLGRLGEIREHGAHAARLLRRLATGDDVVDALTRRLSALDSALVPAGLHGPVLISPLPQHLAIPWSALPSLGDSSVTVAHRLGHWLAADRRAGHGAAPAPRHVAVLGGPDVEMAGGEVEAIGAVWGAARTEIDPVATVGQAMRALASADLLHLACHGQRRANDGQFAELRLADGELLAIEVETLPRTPATVVLAACEAGILEPLRGDESAGLGRSLFAATTDTVIAAATLLPDTPATVAAFVGLHSGLAAGLRPGAALAAVRAGATDSRDRLLRSALTCYGWG